jgi:hypothetical protein
VLAEEPLKGEGPSGNIHDSTIHPLAVPVLAPLMVVHGIVLMTPLRIASSVSGRSTTQLQFDFLVRHTQRPRPKWKLAPVSQKPLPES